jgi:hypothetical protein
MQPPGGIFSRPRNSIFTLQITECSQRLHQHHGCSTHRNTSLRGSSSMGSARMNHRMLFMTKTMLKISERRTSMGLPLVAVAYPRPAAGLYKP